MADIALPKFWGIWTDSYSNCMEPFFVNVNEFCIGAMNGTIIDPLGFSLFKGTINRFDIEFTKNYIPHKSDSFAEKGLITYSGTGNFEWNSDTGIINGRYYFESAKVDGQGGFRGTFILEPFAKSSFVARQFYLKTIEDLLSKFGAFHI